MSVVNYYKLIPKKYLEATNYYNPNVKQGALEHPFRCAIIGGSGSFKTNTAMNIINICNCFETFYIIAKKLDEPLYKWLIDTLSQISEDIVHTGDKIEDVPMPQDVDNTKQTLIIIDDMINEDLKKAKGLNEMLIRGRKDNCSIIFISQTYFAIPKKIRNNCNYFILKEINNKNDIRSIATNFALNQTTDQIYDMYNRCSNDVNFFLIDLATKDRSLQFRKNFNEKVYEDSNSNNKKSKKVV